MYKIYFSTLVWDNENIEISSNWSEFTWQIDLPFVPFVGLDMQFPLLRTWKLKSVAWSIDNNYFACRCEDIFTDPLSEYDGHTFEQWVERLKSAGWKSDGAYPNEKKWRK